jgi:hypothetical protein
MRRFHFIFLLLSVVCFTYAQIVPVNQSEVLLHNLFNRLYSAKNDTHRQSINDSICKEFTQIFLLPASFDYPFDSLQYVGKIYSTDRALRIYSWNYITQSGNYHFECFIQRKQDDAVFRLKQPLTVYLPQEQGRILPNNWYGALYYNAIPYKYQKKTVYLLLGWSRYSENRNFKMIDVLSFENKKICLGDPLFHANESILSRVIIPYTSRYALTLQYDQKDKMIIFNHLSSGNNGSTAIPDENFSAYLITKTGLKLKEDLLLKDKQIPHTRSHYKVSDSLQ